MISCLTVNRSLVSHLGLFNIALNIIDRGQKHFLVVAAISTSHQYVEGFVEGLLNVLTKLN